MYVGLCCQQDLPITEKKVSPRIELPSRVNTIVYSSDFGYTYVQLQKSFSAEFDVLQVRSAHR